MYLNVCISVCMFLCMCMHFVCNVRVCVCSVFVLYMCVCLYMCMYACRVGIVTQAHCPLGFPDRSSHWPRIYKDIRLAGQRAPGIQMSPLPQLGLHTQDTTLSASYMTSCGGTQPLVDMQQIPLLMEPSHQLCSQFSKPAAPTSELNTCP